jgi:hypothetical protein
VEHTPHSPFAEADLRARARLRAAHFSTFVEGNHLTIEETSLFIADDRAPMPKTNLSSIYTGYWLREGSTDFLTGYFEAFIGTGGTAQRPVFGWYACKSV